jgi:DNA replication and repair protein RecF
LLDSYTEPLVEAGVELSRARADAAARWAPEFHEATNHITGGALSAHLHYQPSFLGDEGSQLDEMQAASHFRERLQRQADAERVRKTTLSGPHLDDLTLEVHERKARRLASQGEARALVLALKIASVRLYRDVRGTAPLLLLDDVAGELDPTKARCLFETAAGLGAQTFVTATHTGVLPALKEAKIVQLQAGQVVE